jgi:hypothetical protein
MTLPTLSVSSLFDVNLLGDDLNVWTYETTRKMVRYGHVGVLVDAPANGGRPYWVTYTPRQILGWRAEQQEGKQVLTQLRLAEMVTVPDGEFGEKAVEQIRVLTPGEFQLHQKQDNGEFEIIDEGRTSLSEIPFSVAYAQRQAFMESRPPLEDIAELNLKAYQIQSDLDNQLHISALCRCWHSLASHLLQRKSALDQVRRLHFLLKGALNISNLLAAASITSSSG